MQEIYEQRKLLAITMRKEGKTYKEIAKLLNISKERARQLNQPARVRVCKQCPNPLPECRYKLCFTCRPVTIKLKRNKGRPGRQWTPEEELLIGTMTDKKLALKLGITFDMVRGKRLLLKIKPYRKHI